MTICYKSTLIILFLFISLLLSAQNNNNKDDNFIIADKKEIYEYTLVDNQVVIKAKFKTNYINTKRIGNLTTYEMYDNESSIDNVKVTGVKGIKPRHTMHKSDGIFYSDAKICYIDLPFDKIGKKISVEIEKTYKNPRYFTSIYLEEPEYIEKKTVQIIVPSWMNVEFNEYNFKGNINKSVDIDQKNKHYTYTYIIENEPAMKFEKNMQGHSFIYPHLLILNKSAEINGEKITYFETLSDLYDWYRSIINQVNNDVAIISSKAKEIIKDCNNDLDKIKAIYSWVQENIRYIAFEDGIAGFKPDYAQEVLRKKYGDCKGMANLVTALLKAEGFDARLTWIGTNHIAYDYTSPTLATDNHIICTLFHNDQIYFLDPTVEYMPLGEYPQTIQGRQIMIENGDNFIIDRIPEYSSQQNTDSLYCELNIRGDILEGKACNTFKGESKQIIVSAIKYTPKHKLEGVIKSFLENENVLDTASDIKLEDENSQSKITSISYTIKRQSGIKKLDNEYFLDLNPIKDLMTHIIDIKERKHNLLMSYKRHHVREIILNIPNNYEVSHIPDNFSIIKDNYEFRISYFIDDNKLTYKSEINIKEPLILKENFFEWNNDIEKLKRNYLEQIILTKTTSNEK
ncbi:hypothetical protein LJB98_05945 [Bacteroidales bacterium OttesenSCG-928-M11]|nr:hypothetical protein [Bacteroidales bacterium OttesenSCG-928-M11]